MRNLIYAINLSLDGCCDHTKMVGNEEVQEYFAGLLRDVDTLVYGRITYQLMVPFWPDIAKNNSGTNKAMNEFAQAFDSVGKIVVFSRTLDKADREKTRIVRTNLKDEILRLKQQEGAAIMVGGVDLPNQLIELGLVDEFIFVVQSLIVGGGRRLAEGISLPDRLALKLVGSEVLACGFVALHYLKA